MPSSSWMCVKQFVNCLFKLLILWTLSIFLLWWLEAATPQLSNQCWVLYLCKTCAKCTFFLWGGVSFPLLNCFCSWSKTFLWSANWKKCTSGSCPSTKGRAVHWMCAHFTLFPVFQVSEKKLKKVIKRGKRRRGSVTFLKEMIIFLQIADIKKL